MIDRIRSSIPKWLLAVCGTLLLGAIGSGIWDAIVKPVLPWLAELLLNVATLGLKGLRDSIYVEIARGAYERAGLSTLLLIEGAIAGAGICLVVAALVAIKFSKDQARLPFVPGVHVIRRVLMTVALLISLVSGYFVIEAARMTYIVRAANHMEQYERIVSPYLTEDQRLSLASRIAQIASKEDYETIISEFDAIAKQRGLRAPAFDIY
jgi:hypothetical protein